MSEQLRSIRSKGLQIKSVVLDSPASRAGLLERDVIRQVNGIEVNDLLDFRFHTSEEACVIEIVRQGEYQTIELERRYGEEIGIEFTFELADQIHTCDNKCVFCFIHQMPKGMRKTLYLMDDDFRLSFLHGNYVTLTNMSEEEFSRIKEQGLSPLYVSVHSTDGRLRGYMLGRTSPEPILPRLLELFAAGISVHCQVVLCPGMNDGEALDRTIRELSDLHPLTFGGRAGVLSIAVVPVGLTKFRHHLYSLSAVEGEYAKAFLRQIDEWHRILLPKLGTRLVFPTDEWYYYAGAAIPPRKFYENFPQFEDGVGTSRLFIEEAKQGFRRARHNYLAGMKMTFVTGELASGVLEWFAGELNNRFKMQCDVLPVRNDFFGPGINVAGLVTGQDLIRALKSASPEGIVAVPTIMLKDESLFLDDISLEDVRRETGLSVRAVPHRAEEFLRVLAK